MIQLYCMSNYVTTNIRISEEDYLRLKEEAAKKRTSLSAVIREKIGAKKKKRLTKEDWLKELRNLKTGWFTEKDYKAYLAMRKKDKVRSKMYNW